MKRIIALAASAAMACTMFLTGCSMSEDSIENQLKSSLDETYQTLVDTFSDSGSKFSMVEEYIKSWAKTNEIEVSKLDDHYMVLTNKATKNAGKSESVALQCSVNTSDIASANQPLAVGLTSLLGPAFIGYDSNVKMYLTMAVCFGVTALWGITSWRCIIKK